MKPDQLRLECEWTKEVYFAVQTRTGHVRRTPSTRHRHRGIRIEANGRATIEDIIPMRPVREASPFVTDHNRTCRLPRSAASHRPPKAQRARTTSISRRPHSLASTIPSIVPPSHPARSGEVAIPKAHTAMKMSARLTICPGGQAPDWLGTGPSTEVTNCVSSPRLPKNTVLPSRPRHPDL